MSWGEELKQWVVWQSQKCCSNFPATACDKDAKLMTPCAADDDFMPENVVTGPGGGATCKEKIEDPYWTLVLKNLKQATDAGTCTGVTFEYFSVSVDLPQQVSMLSRDCCSTFPATACDKDVKFMSPCAADADFMPENVMGEDGSTCKEAMESPFYKSQVYEALKQAADAGTCTGVTVNGEGPSEDLGLLSEMVVPLAQNCCSTFPATACDKDAGSDSESSSDWFLSNSPGLRGMTWLFGFVALLKTIMYA